MITTIRCLLLCAGWVVLSMGALGHSEETNVIAKENQASREDVRRLLKATNGAEMGKQVFNRVIDMFSDLSPNVPDSVWAEMRTAFDMNDITEKVVPVYQRHLNGADIKELAKFFESPLGQRFIEASPPSSGNQCLSDSCGVPKSAGRS